MGGSTGSGGRDRDEMMTNDDDLMAGGDDLGDADLGDGDESGADEGGADGADDGGDDDLT